MKRWSVPFSLMLFLFICMAALSFPTDIEACQCLGLPTERQNLKNYEFMEMASSVNTPVQREEERLLFENIITYLIIFTPVLVVTLIVWIFCRILKLTKEKE
jgi:heme/copper-type cytochrome/quinol oxidase subunit 2